MFLSLSLTLTFSASSQWKNSRTPFLEGHRSLLFRWKNLARTAHTKAPSVRWFSISRRRLRLLREGNWIQPDQRRIGLTSCARRKKRSFLTKQQKCTAVKNLKVHRKKNRRCLKRTNFWGLFSFLRKLSGLKMILFGNWNHKFLKSEFFSQVYYSHRNSPSLFKSLKNWIFSHRRFLSNESKHFRSKNRRSSQNLVTFKTGSFWKIIIIINK